MRKNKEYFGFARKHRSMPGFVTWSGRWFLRAGTFVVVIEPYSVYPDATMKTMYDDTRKGSKSGKWDKLISGKHRNVQEIEFTCDGAIQPRIAGSLMTYNFTYHPQPVFPPRSTKSESKV